MNGRRRPAGSAVPSVHPERARSTQWHRSCESVVSSFCHVRRVPNDVVQATRLPFDPGSPVRRPTWRGVGARRSCRFENRRQKQPEIMRRIQPARSAEGPFSLRRGLEAELDFLKLGITPWTVVGWG
jgi:hypothetical protein